MPSTSPVAAARFAVPTLYLGSAVALAMLVVLGERESNVFAESQHAEREIMFVIAAAFFVLSAILVLLWPHRGYTTALFSALAAISCLAWREFSNFYWGNSWIVLNAPVVLSPVGERMRQAAVWLPILTAFLASVSFFLSAWRLLPERWTVRGFPMRRRSWPAFALSGMTLAVWFGCSVMPYRVPGNAHLGVHSHLRILHVEKRGLRLHETAVSVFKDGRFVIWRVDRRLFDYRFTGHGANGLLPTSMRLRALNLAETAPNRVPTPPPGVLWAWRAEGWYVVGSGVLLSFTSDHRSVVPQEVKQLFEGIMGLAVRGEQQETERDICLGFCYGPVAALGYVYQNYYCRSENGAVKCP